MKIVALSDLHGFLPDIPPCDLVLLGGDLTPVFNHSLDFQEGWLDTNFRFWLKSIQAKKIVGCFGNHDLIAQEKPHWVPKDLPWTYLQDSGTEFEGLKIWGSPWQLTFGYGWAFNLSELELSQKWNLIPKDTDILVMHSPVYGHGDTVNDKGKFKMVGSPSLLEKIKEIKPKLVTTGHVHSGYSKHYFGDTIIANVSVLNDDYKMVNKPMVFEL